MKIALVGYGKMGHAIERIATERGHEVVLKITSSNRNEFTLENLQKADAVIEFTKPEAALDNVRLCLEAGVPTVCGTTGWNEGLAEIRAYCEANNGSFLQASNFSIGVNIFFEINKKLAQLMSRQPAYNVRMEETHHTQKKDAPSGTAITLAEQIVERLDRKTGWALADDATQESVAITAHRIENVPGTHNVLYTSAIDDIEIIHTAHNRDGFALGAVLAAEYAAAHKGWHTMQDVLGL